MSNESPIQTISNVGASRTRDVAAYYFPSYHADARNSQWHGKGWTEWDLVRGATPRYAGHQQPKIPAWGYFDESDPSWANREICLAADHALTCFIYDWYWYGDKPYLNGGLEQGFLKAPDRHRMKFALMWANHDWNNMFPARFTNRPEIMETGLVSPEVFDHLCEYVIENYFSQNNYLRLDGGLYFSIYELGTFIKGMGGVGQARRALENFRERCQRAGVGDLHLNTVVWQLAVLPGELKLANADEVIRELGLDSATSYAWVHHYGFNNATFPQDDYNKAALANHQVWDHYAQTLSVPYYPNVSMGWDPSPRTCQTNRYENRGYPWTSVLEGNTPQAFEYSLQKARDFIERTSAKSSMVTLNAWNEWTEGSYLLPDTVNDDAYLKAISRTFGSAHE